MNRRSVFTTLAASAVALASFAGAAAAQEVTLRLHQFLPTPAVVPAKILVPWGEAVEAASGGRIEIQHFDAMSLGGGPPQLIDQARDGVVDLVMTLPGYTPGRFPSVEVFELPFMMTDPAATAAAFWTIMEEDLQDSEFADFKMLGAWVHGPGVIHSEEPVTSLEDMAGQTLRGPTRVINDLLGELGATPVGMPVPAVPEALSKGVINGTVIPWEVTAPLRLSELVGNHTEFTESDEALYTATIVLAMNKDRWNSLPADLQEIIMAESGAKLSRMAAQVMYDFDAPARDTAVSAGNNIITLSAEEIARWKAASEPVVGRWIADMEGRGIDGQALIDRARALIAEEAAM